MSGDRPANDELRIAVVGLGHWGPNHVRVFSSLPDVRVVAMCDTDPSRTQQVQRNAPGARVASLADILAAPDIDAVVVATPANTHAAIVEACVQAGKDVLCEKPLTNQLASARHLVDLSEQLGRVLMVGHVFVFNPGIRWLRDYVQSGEMGRIYYIHIEHTNLGPIRPDVNAFWDLGAHGISILNFILNDQPASVSADGAAVLRPRLADVGFANFRYPNSILANLHVSWLDPKKVRQITIVGERRMVTWDDLSRVGPIAIHDKGADRSPTAEPYYATFGEFQLLVRNGDIHIPSLSPDEPLLLQARHFVQAIRSRCAEPASARAGAAVVAALTAVDQSLRCDAHSVTIGGE